MLVLKRKPHEQITIRVAPSADVQVITVTLIEATHGVAKIGFDAGHNVVILRKELRDRGAVRHD